MAKDYIYEVARIRVKEASLLTRAQLKQLIALPDIRSALAQLADWGWGNPDEPLEAERMLAAESAKTWELIDELLRDDDSLSLLKLTRDYQNIKAAIKQIYTNTKLPPERLYVSGGRIAAEEIRRAIREQDYEIFPEAMAAAAREAAELLAETGDGQLCDAVLDKAALTELIREGKEAKDPALQEYAALTAAQANVMIALRAAAGGKSREEILNMLAPDGELNIHTLAQAAMEGREAVADYLRFTQYSSLSDSLMESMVSFERSCEDLLLSRMREQKSEVFTIGPLVAYVVVRQNEIKSVRMLLTEKQNHLPESVMRERLREMYV